LSAISCDEYLHCSKYHVVLDPAFNRVTETKQVEEKKPNKNQTTKL